MTPRQVMWLSCGTSTAMILLGLVLFGQPAFDEVGGWETYWTFFGIFVGLSIGAALVRVP